jgi:hypothetical protein
MANQRNTLVMTYKVDLAGTVLVVVNLRRSDAIYGFDIHRGTVSTDMSVSVYKSSSLWT